MHRKYNKFLIVSFIGVLIFGFYTYFYNDLRSEAASSDGTLTSSLDITNGANSQSVKANEDTVFIIKLISLNNLKIDKDLFSENSFRLLIDNNIKLETPLYGRVNPFSPTDVKDIANKTVIVKTNGAVSITNKSAILAGSIEGGTSNSVYFEYGPTATFGKVTPKLTLSLIGNFSSNIIGLTQKTTYYYRSVANINGANVYGEVMSFNTN